MEPGQDGAQDGQIIPTEVQSFDRSRQTDREHPERSYGWNHVQMTEPTVPELVFPDQLAKPRLMVMPRLMVKPELTLIE